MPQVENNEQSENLIQVNLFLALWTSRIATWKNGLVQQ